MLRTFLFAIPGELDLALHAPCYLDAVAQLRRLGHAAYLLKGWSHD